MFEQVYHPNHYADGNIECIDAIREQLGPEGFAAYCQGNVAKYLWRWKKKGGIQDLEKAQVYLGWMIEALSPPLKFEWSKGKDTLLQRVCFDKDTGEEADTTHISVAAAEADLREAARNGETLLKEKKSDRVYGYIEESIPWGQRVEYWDCEEETYPECSETE